MSLSFFFLNVLVRDHRSGARISGLRLENFEIYEDKILQQPLSLQEDEAPLRLLLLLDVSDSSAGYSELLRRAIREASLLCGFTSDRAELERAVSAIRTGGGTGFYPALDFALQILSGVPSRKALVVFSDGVDDT